jgi:bloom syndrome protein
LSTHKRNSALDDWKEGRVECIVATIAFGMGVDQPHVRYVVHFDMPKSFEGESRVKQR